MSFDEEHLGEHYECEREFALLKERVDKLAEALRRIDENCTEYLSVGGLFNPELMEHEKVRRMVRRIADLSRNALTICGFSRQGEK